MITFKIICPRNFWKWPLARFKVVIKVCFARLICWCRVCRRVDKQNVGPLSGRFSHGWRTMGLHGVPCTRAYSTPGLRNARALAPWEDQGRTNVTPPPHEWESNGRMERGEERERGRGWELEIEHGDDFSQHLWFRSDSRSGGNRERKKQSGNQRRHRRRKKKEDEEGGRGEELAKWEGERWTGRRRT